MTPKQERFIQEYQIDWNASAAAIRAGYSKKCAKETGSDLLSNPNIRAELERLQAERNAKHELTLERILTGLLKEAELHKSEGGTPSVRVAAWRAIAEIGGFSAPQRIELDVTPLAARLEAARKRVAAFSLTTSPEIPPSNDETDKEIPKENREKIAGRTYETAIFHEPEPLPERREMAFA
ncbi:MAG: terminase small subunit [Candidatus Omnitrophota bacterium]